MKNEDEDVWQNELCPVTAQKVVFVVRSQNSPCELD